MSLQGDLLVGRLCGHDRRFNWDFSKQNTFVRRCGASATLKLRPDDTVFDAEIFLIDGVARGVCASPY